jgi:hypothetical protein
MNRLAVIIGFVAAMLFSPATASASNGYLGANSRLEKFVGQSEFQKELPPLNEELHRLCDDSCCKHAADMFVAPKNVTPPVTMAGNTGLTATTDLVRAYAPNVKPVKGFTDVFIHGAADGKSFQVLHNGKWVDLTHRDLATYLRSQNISGDIRLISCNSGVGDLSQNLANKHGANVRAPTNTITVHPDGTLTAPSGTVWKDFAPGGK